MVPKKSKNAVFMVPKKLILYLCILKINIIRYEAIFPTYYR